MQITAKNMESYPGFEKMVDYYQKVSKDTLAFDQTISNELTLVSVEPNVLTYEFEVKDHHCHAFGYIHGGCVSSLIDTCSGFAILVAKSKPWNMIGVSTSLSVAFFRAVPKGSTVYITCEVESIGKSIANIYTKVYDEEGRLCFKGSHAKFNNSAKI